MAAISSSCKLTRRGGAGGGVVEQPSSCDAGAGSYSSSVEMLASNNHTPTSASQMVETPSVKSTDSICRICRGAQLHSSDFGRLLSTCACKGTVGKVHVRCLERWLTESGKSGCELCGAKYALNRIHKFGVLKSIFIWVFSQNSKQFLLDMLGIGLMSPVAVLAAWLCGKTLAGLMALDRSVRRHAPPWPLASTFVLSCMTLVCYYCWIVSAITRHAVGWWFWHRTQYEVQLLLDEDPGEAGQSHS